MCSSCARVAQGGAELGDRLPHRGPVGDRGKDVVDDRRELVAETREDLGVGLAVDLEVQVRRDPDPRLLEQRVDEQVDVVAPPRQRRAHAVDQERGVVADDVDHRVR